MSALIKPGDLPIAIQLSFTDIGKQFKQNYKRPLNEYSKYFPEENYIKLLENNTPKGFTSKFLKSSSAFLYKKQETQEEILKRYNIKEREKQVIYYICQELTSADIASKLNIDVWQVEALRKIIMHKLGSLNVVGVAFFAVATGIAELPEA
jgi:DNA-binding CsgD family transcriptional regulator